MKKLLTIILLAIAITTQCQKISNGIQPTFYGYSLCPDTSLNKANITDFGKDDNTSLTYKPIMPRIILDTEVYPECITINQLLQYEKECYNDSTYRRFVLPIHILNGDTIRGYYRHQEPTFKGFLKWIKDKYEL